MTRSSRIQPMYDFWIVSERMKVVFCLISEYYHDNPCCQEEAAWSGYARPTRTERDQGVSTDLAMRSKMASMNALRNSSLLTNLATMCRATWFMDTDSTMVS